MKRVLVLALVAVTATGAWAQGTFTIRRPLDGASVREVVKVRIPKNSIPEGGYLGIYLNGKFIEASLPEIDGDDYVYSLDTQARQLDDGPAKLEVVLFMDVNGKSIVKDKSSVNLKIDNHTSIKVPGDGFKLRYRLNSGQERVYAFSNQQEVGMVSQAQAQLGSRAAMVSSDNIKLRLLYATDNAYAGKNGREGLMRVQILPDKGKDTATIIPPGKTTTEVITQDQMSPLYLRMTDVGREVFGASPIYFGMEGRNGALPKTLWFPLFPWPVLPTKGVKPGDTWVASEMMADVDAKKIHDVESFFAYAPARGEFLGVQWFKGMPCAKIRNVVAMGPELLKNSKNLGQVKGQASNISVESTYYFALDRGLMIRQEEVMTQESLIEVGGGGGGAGGTGTAGARKGGPAGGGGDDSPPGLGSGFMRGPEGMEFKPGSDADGNFWLFQQRGGRKGGGAAGGRAGGNAPPDDLGLNTGNQDEQNSRGGTGGRFGQRGNTNNGPRKMVMRIRSTSVLELEQ